MTTLIVHSGHLTARSLRALLRQPFYVAVTLVQPLIWLLLFGQLFSGVAKLPGFGGGPYVEFLTPGVVMMTALFSSGWAGMAFIQDSDRGIMDRFLTSPVNRGAIMIGGLANQATTTVVQSVIIVGIGILAGARFGGGVLGVLVTMVLAVLLAAAFASLSNGLALLLRRQEALIGVAQFLVLPLSFLSSAMMAPGLMPSWVDSVARFNPMNWAVVASREALESTPDWGIVLSRGGLLLGFTVVMALLATRAFTIYQRSV